jgi:hypothetical protein
VVSKKKLEQPHKLKEVNKSKVNETKSDNKMLKKPKVSQNEEVKEVV